jgi:hypothetical protein
LGADDSMMVHRSSVLQFGGLRAFELRAMSKDRMAELYIDVIS